MIAERRADDLRAKKVRSIGLLGARLFTKVASVPGEAMQL